MAIPNSAAPSRRTARPSRARAIQPVETPSARTLTGSQILCEALEAEGVEVMFGYPGGAITPFYDALISSSVRHMPVRPEAVAAIRAGDTVRADLATGVIEDVTTGRHSRRNPIRNPSCGLSRRVA